MLAYAPAKNHATEILYLYQCQSYSLCLVINSDCFYPFNFKIMGVLFNKPVGMLSDAIESIVNVGAAIMALTMLTIAARPADDDHAFGHSKVEYFRVA